MATALHVTHRVPATAERRVEQPRRVHLRVTVYATPPKVTNDPTAD
jgi:hypothetical protein